MGCANSKHTPHVPSKKIAPSTSSEQDQDAAQEEHAGAGDFQALQLKSAVKVVVVVRPLLDAEKQKGGTSCLEVQNGTTVVLAGRKDRPADSSKFEYDRVYRMVNPGRQMFAEVVQPLLGHFLQGFNTTIFAYGQTGSGKTFCMGTSAAARAMQAGGEAEGVIPRAVRFLFDALPGLREHYDVSLKVSFVEIYQDDIRDLLGDSDGHGAAPALRESPERGIHLENIQEVEVRGEAEVAQLLEAGNVHRAVASHNLNDASSRSHAICTLQMEQRRKASAPASKQAARFLRSKLHLVDLAGSERAKETGTTGQTFAEGVNVNKGLLALGNVIGALAEGERRTHVPYRDSKLTRILQDSLGGNSETLMIACASPASFNLEPTLSTLRYASRARAIQNRVKQNSRYTLEDEVAYLREQLAERNAMVGKLQSQLDMAVKMLKGASSPGGLQLALPAQLASPGANSPGLASMRLSYAGSSGHGPRAPF